jgi:eukaryotic-like serine/threonine-protein kinase
VNPIAHPMDTSATSAVTTIDSGESERASTELYREGARIGDRYEVLGLLGVGGFGEVYRVRDDRQEGVVRALKLGRFSAGYARALEALRSEFALLASLSHPNLARVFDFGHIGDSVAYFTQELVAGKPLHESGLRPDDPAAVPIWAQLCRALVYLHSRGILHRDIKPSNIIVDVEAGRLTLLDFGVAMAFGGLDRKLLVGTFAYMAPEAIAGGPIDVRSDLYSLGVTLYRQGAGRVPFRGSTSEVVSGHLTALPEPLAELGVRPPVDRVVERLLCKEPGARYASALELLHALAAANGVELAPESGESLASYVLSARFVGHERALERLSQAVAAGPSSQPLLVVGEGGSGKSRLLRETGRRAQLAKQSWLVVTVKRGSGEQATLLAIARAVLTDSAAARLDDDDRLELARGLPELRRPRERIGIAVDPDRARLARIDALGRLLALRFEESPGALVIEDLHAAPPALVPLLERMILAANAAQARCLFVLAARPGEIAELAQSRLSAERIACDALGPDACRRLVESMFGGAGLLAGSDLGRALGSGEHTAQYVQESLRNALEAGAIQRQGEAWRSVQQIPALALPELLARRFERRDHAERKAALALALLGEEASAMDVAAVAGQRGEVGTAALHGLVRSGLVEQRHGGGLAVYAMHERYRDVVLERCPERWQQKAHRRAARFLRRTARGDWRQLFEAAEHFAAGGETRAAIAACLEGAGLAERGGRPDQALPAIGRAIALGESLAPVALALLLRRFDVALPAGAGRAEQQAALGALEAAVDRGTELEQVEVALRRARLAMRIGEPERARAECEAALARASALGQARLEVEILLLAAETEEDYGKLDGSLRQFERAAEIAGPARLHALEARAWLGASLAAVRLGWSTRGGELADRAYQAARAARDPVLLADALRHVGNAFQGRGESARAMRLYKRAVRAARDGGSPESEAKALNNLATVCQWLGRIPEAFASLERSLALKRRLGLHASAMITSNNLGALCLAVGQHDRARAELEAILADATLVQQAPTVLALAYSNRADLYTLSHDFSRALEVYRAALEINRERATALQQSHSFSGVIRTLLMRDHSGDLEEARRVLDAFEALVEPADSAEARVRYHTAAAAYFDRTGEHPRALEHVRRAKSTRSLSLEFMDVFGSVLEARWQEAILSARLGRRRAAERAAERTRLGLLKLARWAGGEREQRRYLEASPLCRCILAQRLDTPPGWSWLPV